MLFLRLLLRLSLFGFLGAIWLLAGVYLYLSPNLPDVETLRDVKLQTPMRVYTRNGDLIGQFGEQKRSPLKFDEIPPQFVDALLAAEDDNFFNHRGIDLMGLMRAVSELVLTGEKGSGGSTLTMQVARNYFLTLDRTFIRKFNEILLAIEIERRLSKEEIFELYCNRIFLGHRSYGFGAAAQVYYGTTLDDLELPQLAMLAGIPKAPSRNNPISGPESGKQRRDWILGRMEQLGYISAREAATARSAPISARHHGARISFAAHYAAEMARQEMLDRFGIAAYTGGYHVYTTIDGELQRTARRAVIDGLLTYDDRHGYRGPERRLGQPRPDGKHLKRWQETLAGTAIIAGLEPVAVTEVLDDGLNFLRADGSTGFLAFDHGIHRAAPYRGESRVGPRPTSTEEVLAAGDMIRITTGEDGEPWLSQVPAAQAALVSLDPNDGAIISVVGGMGFELSKFNRATQAMRQPGSSFKPFLYSAALDAGFTAASLINDAPVVLEDRALEDIWRPENDGGKFYGPTRLRWALTKSRNLVSIRLLQRLGIPNLVEYIDSLGFDGSEFAPDLSLALGTHAMSPMDVATAYAILANGGYRVEPYLVARVENLDGDVVYEALPPTVCESCNEEEEEDALDTLEELSMEEILAAAEEKDPLPVAPRVMDERVNFIVDSMLRDVIRRGTATRARSLERGDIAGKTGTTNGPMDAWFSGYNRDVVTTTWVGFDNYTPLGRREFGGTAALPIWIEYMTDALATSEERERPLPEGIVNVRIDPATGQLAGSTQSDAIFEFFREEYVPQQTARSDGLPEGDAGLDDLVSDIF